MPFGFQFMNKFPTENGKVSIRVSMSEDVKVELVKLA